MRRNRVFRTVAFVLVALAFACGLYKLLLVTYRLGDYYPEYSTFRTDPMGARVLYESLQAVPGLSVSRNIESLKTLRLTAPATMCILGADARDIIEVSQEGYEGLESIVARGGRLVITYSPEMTRTNYGGEDTLEEAQKKAVEREKKANAGKEGKETDTATPKSPTEPIASEKPANAKPEPQKEAAKKKDKAGDSKDKDKADKESPELSKRVVLPRAWGYTLSTTPLPVVDDEIQPGKAVRAAEGPLPESLKWRSALVFKDLGPAWRVIYQRDADAVVIERRLGAGTVVMCTDSYFISNQAMRDDRRPELLAWLVGANTRVLFEETHNGVEETPGIAKLARKYRLHGVAAALLVLVALYIWKSASSLVPPAPEPAANESARAALGKDAAAAFINLLRRSVAGRDLLTVCVREWEKAFLRSRPDLQARAAWMRSVAEEQRALPPQRRDPLGTYRTISHELGKEWKR